MSLCLMTSLAGCATPDPIIQWRTQVLVKDRYIPIPTGLTKPCEQVELPETVDTLSLGAAYKALAVRMQECNARMNEIRGLGNE